MFQVTIHKSIDVITEFYYHIYLWHRDDRETVRQKICKLFYSLYYPLFPVSLIAGAVASDIKLDERILLIQSSMIASVLLIRLLYVIWKKQEIVAFLNRICIYDIDDRETFRSINDKIDGFIKFVTVLISTIAICAAAIAFVVPFLGTQKKLFFQIAFPLDWRNDEFAFWMAFTFISMEVSVSPFLISFSVIVWYLMANCSWRYKVLGQQMKRMGESPQPLSISGMEKLYLLNLIEAIKSRNSLVK